MGGKWFANRGQIFQTVIAAVSACVGLVALYFVLKSNNSLPRVSAVMYVSGGIFLLLIGIFIGRRLGPPLPDLSKAIGALPSSSTAVVDSDPRIYLIAIRDGRDRVPPSTPFIVKNRGKHVAHHIHIARGELKLGYRTVGFIPVDNLGAEDEAEILPWTGDSARNKNDIFHVLMEDVEARAKAKGESVPENFGFSFVITHQSFDGLKKFEVTVHVAFKVMKYLYRNNHPDSAAVRQEDMFEIRRSGFKRL